MAKTLDQKPTTANILTAQFAVLRELQQVAFNGVVNAQGELQKQAWQIELSRVNRELLAAIAFEEALAH
jgi:ethanolamine utilization cobalamin adenosyltransferase